MNKELYYCKGSGENPEGVIKALEEKGGVNSFGVYGNHKYGYYYIGKNNNICHSYESVLIELLKTYGIELQPKPKLPKSWEELIQLNFKTYQDDPIYITYNDAEIIEQLSSLYKLLSLRKAWIGDWEFEYNKPAAYVVNIDDEIVAEQDDYITAHITLTFPTIEMAKEFRDCFKDLLEQAKYVL